MDLCLCSGRAGTVPFRIGSRQIEAFGEPTNGLAYMEKGRGQGMGDLKKTSCVKRTKTGARWNRGARLTEKRIGSVWEGRERGRRQ